MAIILFIECSTKTCSVALAKDNVLIASKEIKETFSHAKVLQNLVKKTIEEGNVTFSELDAVCVSGGPGSYTGLRIGMSAAKGFCYALNIPFIVVDSLMALANKAIQVTKDEEAIYIATMDSRRGEIYFCAVNGMGEIIENSQPAEIQTLNFNKYENNSIYLFGNTNNKIKNITFADKVSFLKIENLAENYINIGFKKFSAGHFDDISYKEPSYLKPFI